MNHMKYTDFEYKKSILQAIFGHAVDVRTT